MKKKVIAISSITLLLICLTIGIYFATRVPNFVVAFNSNGGSSVKTQIVKKGEKATEPEIPIKEGYNFEGWYINLNDNQPFNFDTEITNNIDLIAKWTSANNTYKVNHYKMNLDGSTYSVFETENKFGLTDTSVTPEVKTYDGFTSPTTQTVNVSADGSTIVEYYYTRNKYNITLTYNTGISEVSGSGEYYYEEEVPISATLLDGYSFDYWITDDGTQYPDNESKIIMGAKDISLTGNATPNADTTYTVKHYKMNLDGSTYSEPEIETFTGTTDTSVSPEVKTYEGFTSPEIKTTNINGDGSAIVEYYYTRNKYNVTLSYNTGISEVSGSGEYYYEEEVPISATLLDGYSFDYWIADDDTQYPDNQSTLKMKASDISLTANAVPNIDTPYTVKHYKMNLDGSTYSEPEIETLTGTTDTSVSPEVKTYEGFTSPEVQTTNVNGDGSAIIEYYYTRNKYNVTLSYNTGISEVSGSGEYYYEEEVPISATLLDGYSFDYWIADDDTQYPDNQSTLKMKASDISLTANAVPNIDTPYTVKHYKMNLDGSTYSEPEIETLTGTTDTSVSPEVKTYEGFTSPEVQTTNVNGDGSAIIEYYYTRNKYNVTLSYNTGISEVSGSGEYYYEEEVPISATLLDGYSFDYWIADDDTQYPDNQSTLKMKASDISLTANAVPNIDTPYTVKHYKMNLDGSTYSEPEIETLTGTTDTSVSPEVKTYEGFTSPEVQTTNVNGDGSAIIEYYYTRNKYNVTLSYNTGISEVSGSGEYYYEEEVPISATLLDGYSFDYWIADDGTQYTLNETVFKIGATDISLTANAIANIDTPYTVKHYKMNLDGSTYGKPEIETLTGTTNTSVSPEVKTYEGFTSPEVQTTNVNGDGSSIIEYYYTRNKYKVTLKYNTGISNVTGSGEYFYESDVSIKAIPLAGYSFDHWVNDSEIEYQENPLTIKMGTKDVFLTANAIPNVDTVYTVKHYKMNLDGSTYGEPEIETFTGTTDTPVSPAVKTYEGFTSPEVKTTNINGDGSAVVEYHYTRNKYKVTLKYNKGISNVTGSGEYFYESDASISATPQEGYSFDYWVNENEIEYQENPLTIKMGTKDISLTANAKLNEYVITYDANGGNTTTTKQTIKYGEAITKPEDPTYNGYSFVGWFVNLEDSKPFDFASTMPAKNLTLHAKWQANKYTVSFNANGGQGQMDTQEFTYGISSNLKENAFTKTGYSFAGWAETKDGPVKYANNAAVQSLIESGNKELYAVWNAVTYTISYDLDGGTLSKPNVDKYTIETADIILNSPTKEGYKFKEWILDNGTALKNNTIIKGTSGNLNLKATYLLDKNVKVVFNSNNGKNEKIEQNIDFNASTKLNSNTFANSYTVTYNYNYPDKENEVISVDRKFLGWSTVIDGDIVYKDGDPLTNNVNNGDVINLYAKWDTAKVTIKDPVARDNYKFAGWSTSTDKSGIISEKEYPLTNNLTLTAIWLEIPRISSFSFDVKDASGNPYNESIFIGDDTFYMKFPKNCTFDIASLKLTTTIPTLLNPNAVVSHDYVDLAASSISEDGKSGKISVAGVYSLNISTEDKIHWTCSNESRYVSAESFFSLISTFLGGDNLSLAKGFGISDDGIETPHYIGNKVTIYENGTIYMFFKQEGKPDINVTYMDGSRKLLTLTIPRGSISPDIGNYTIVGKTFENWCSDEALTTTYDFNTVLYDDIIIYGKYSLKDMDLSWYENNPQATSFEINSLEQLKGFAYLQSNVTTSFYKKTVNLMSDIDLKNEEWTPITSNTSHLTFNGNNHTISNLKITSYTDKYHCGFFDTIHDCTIKNLKFENVNINVSCLNVGTVAGSTSGNSTIEKVSVDKLSITGKSTIGGIVGNTSGETTITQCSTTNGTIYATQYKSGGIVAEAEASTTLTNLYSNVTVRTNGKTKVSSAGGILGEYSNKENLLTMKNVLFTGTVNAISTSTGAVYGTLGYYGDNSFDNDKTGSKNTWLYDKDKIGLTDETALSRGIPKTTGELTKSATYSNWDKAIWDIIDGSYITLKWLKQ